MYNLSKKSILRSVILNLVRNHEPISRTGIRKLTGQRMATIIEIVKDFIDEGYIIESGNLELPDTKKKKMLCLGKDKYNALGIDIRSNKIGSVLTDMKGGIIRRYEKDIDHYMTKEKMLDAICELIGFQIGDIDKTRLRGIGISNQGILTKDKGSVIFSSQFEHWRSVPLRELIEQRFGLQVYIDDSAVLNLLAEKRFGKARASDNIIYVQIGASFGMSIISGGRFIRGASGVAGEIGHTMVEPRGEQCVCGNYGCLQTVASASVVVKKVVDLLQRGAYSTLCETYYGDYGAINIKAVAEAAGNGDKICLGALDEAGRYIGKALSNVINLLNPEVLIQMICCSSLLIRTIKRIINTNTLYPARTEMAFETASFGENGGELGAAALVLDRIFEIDASVPPEIDIMGEDRL